MGPIGWPFVEHSYIHIIGNKNFFPIIILPVGLHCLDVFDGPHLVAKYLLLCGETT